MQYLDYLNKLDNKNDIIIDDILENIINNIKNNTNTYPLTKKSDNNEYYGGILV